MKATALRIRLHGCPRCHGDLFRDEEGLLACLQCGRAFRATQVATPPIEADEGKELAGAAA